MELFLKSLALEAAIEAGIAIMEVYNRNFNVVKKTDNSPLTEADVQAHTIISAVLNKSGIPILSEEGTQTPYATRSEWGQFWIVDPLDGTKEFVKRNGEFTVNIALIVKNKPVFGVIYAPFKNAIYAGGLEIQSSYKLINPKRNLSWDVLVKNGSLLKRKQKRFEELQDVKVITSRSHLNAYTEQFIEELQVAGKKIELISSGSALKFCLIAEGKADVYPRFAPCMEWDTAAGDAICQGVGKGVYKENTSEKLLYNKESLLSPNFVAY